MISRAQIGSFLSSIRVQTDNILIYGSFQVRLLAVKLLTFYPINFMGFFMGFFVGLITEKAGLKDPHGPDEDNSDSPALLAML